MNKMLIYRHFSFTYLFNVSEGRCMPFIYYVLSNKSNKWQANTQDLLGNYNNYTTGFNTGEWTTAKTYNQDNGRLMTIITGPVSNRIQDLQYNYDAIGNLISRADNKPANAQLGYQVDEYTYDELNRLSAFSYGNQNIVPVVKTINYDNGGLGNITTMPDVGNFTYDDTQRLHAITQITNNPGNINTTQQVDYTSFNKVLKLEDGQSGTAAFKKLMFKYGPDYSRRKTSYYEGTSAVSVDKYFALGCYEEEVNNTTGIAVKDFYINAGDGLAAIYRITRTNPGVMYYIHKDNMGSFDKVTNESGVVVDRYSFDAWGNRHNYDNWTLSDNSTHLFSRGYTGHEHLDKFGLINMNGRLYDSKLGRFLSPDPVLQDPSNTQNYNRYSYCLNNPFRYYDPSGYEYDDYDYDGDHNDPRAHEHIIISDVENNTYIEIINYFYDTPLTPLPMREPKEIEIERAFPGLDFVPESHTNNYEYDNKSSNGEHDDYRNDDFNNIWNWDFDFNDDRISKSDDHYVNEQPNGNFTYGDLDGRFSKNETWAKHQDDSQDESNAELTTYALVCHFFENLFGLNNSEESIIPTNNSDHKQRIHLPEDQRFVVDSIDFIGDNFIILYTGGDSLIHTNKDASEMLKNGDWTPGWLK